MLTAEFTGCGWETWRVVDSSSTGAVVLVLMADA